MEAGALAACEPRRSYTKILFVGGVVDLHLFDSPHILSLRWCHGVESTNDVGGTVSQKKAINGGGPGPQSVLVRLSHLLANSTYSFQTGQYVNVMALYAQIRVRACGPACTAVSGCILHGSRLSREVCTARAGNMHEPGASHQSVAGAAHHSFDPAWGDSSCA